MDDATGPEVARTRFEDALLYAAHAHEGQRRKSTSTPYVSHLMAVAALVWDYGGDEDQVIGALLHDVAEDQGGEPRLADVERRFGPAVTAIVRACSDSLVDTTAAQGVAAQKAPWMQRKVAYLDHLGSPDLISAALLVAAADKLHNARSLLGDLRADGPAMWARFNAGPADQLWYYRSAVDVLRRRLPGAITEDLADVVDHLAAEQEAASGAAPDS